jgi:hypothetical protein
MNLILLSLAATLAASPQPQWLDDYGEALNAARSSRRPLLIVLEDSTAGSRFRHISHRPDAGQTQLLEPYTLCRVDVSTSYGRKVAEAFQATSFPTAVVTDKTATKVVARKIGHQSSGDWASFLTAYRTGRAPAPRPALTFPAFSPPGGCFT